MNRVQPNMTYTKELQQKTKKLDKLILKNNFITHFYRNIVPWQYLEKAVVFCWVLRGVSPKNEL